MIVETGRVAGRGTGQFHQLCELPGGDVERVPDGFPTTSAGTWPRPPSRAELGGRGLVVREGPAGRGRRTGLSLTDDGRAAVECALPLVRAFDAPDAIGVSGVRTAPEAVDGMR